MHAPARTSWAQDDFSSWAEGQLIRYEFDGMRPVPTTAGTMGHETIVQNLYGALHRRLRGTGYRPFGPSAGLATIGSASRYPDGPISCAPQDARSRLVRWWSSRSSASARAARTGW